MSDTTPNRAKAIFAAALELPPEARAAYLDRVCAGDAALRSKVADLLALHEVGGAFLRAPTARVAPADSTTAAAGAGGAAPRAAASDRGADPLVGTRIGPYKLLELIGEGGFGSVYMAQQEQPVRRRVALKVLKPGMDSRMVAARFEAERQALALMEHPHIARVFDGGVVDSGGDSGGTGVLPVVMGRPYFVMEYVKGDPVTEFADAHKLSVRARLDLFMQVCQAVQHAHTKGIIHRDIKPRNVLANMTDGKPFARVIDFGIAKATGAALTDKTLFTEHRQLLGTPEYMSPEQVEGSPDIDTRTDVYALGVLLYELLAGNTPHDSRRLRSAAFAEMQRIIKEEEPPAPSVRLGRDLAALAQTATARQAEPAALSRLVRGELDWIVMKALEKDRARRYETANQLAEDVGRHLSGEPVIAAPPSVAYRVWKFVRKHRTAVATTSTVVAALVLGVGGASVGLMQAARANRELREHYSQAEATIEDLFGAIGDSTTPSTLRSILWNSDVAVSTPGGSVNFPPLGATSAPSGNSVGIVVDGQSPKAFRYRYEPYRDANGRERIRVVNVDGVEEGLFRRFALSRLGSVGRAIIEDNQRLVLDLDRERVAAITAREQADSMLAKAREGLELTAERLIGTHPDFPGDHNDFLNRPGEDSIDSLVAAAWLAATWVQRLVSEARHEADLANVAAAAAALREGDPVTTRARLNACSPLGGRDWEWRYLWAKADDALLTVVHWRWLDGSAWGGRILVERVNVGDGSKGFTTEGDASLTTLRRFDLRSGVLLSEGTYPDQFGKCGAVSPEGTLAVANDGSVYDGVTGARIGTLPEPPARSRFSPDETIIASADAHGLVRFWTAHKLEADGPAIQCAASLRDMALSADKRWFAATDDESVTVWDRSSGEPVTTEAVQHADDVYFTDDDGWLIVSSGGRDGAPMLRIAVGAAWNCEELADYPRVVLTHDARFQVRAGKLYATGTADALTTLPAHPHRIAVCTERNVLVTAGIGRPSAIDLWDIPTGHKLGSLNGELNFVARLTFADDARRVIAESYYCGSTRVWDVDSVRVPRWTTTLGEGAFSPDGALVVSEGENQIVEVRIVCTGELIAQLRGHAARLVYVQWRGEQLLTVSDDGMAFVWNPVSGEKHAMLTLGEGLTGVQFCEDGETVATLDQDGRVQRWAIRTGQTVGAPVVLPIRRRSFQPYGKVEQAKFSRDAGRLLVETNDGNPRRVRLFDTHLGRQLLEVNDLHDGYWAVDPEFARFAAFPTRQPLTVWDVETGQILGKLVDSATDDAQRPDRCAFMGRGPLVTNAGIPIPVKGEDGDFHLPPGQRWSDYPDSARDAELRNLESDYSFLAERMWPNPRGGRVATIDGFRVIIRDVNTGRALLTLSPVLGANQFVREVAFSTDGSLLIAFDGEGRLLGTWDSVPRGNRLRAAAWLRASALR